MTRRMQRDIENNTQREKVERYIQQEKEKQRKNKCLYLFPCTPNIFTSPSTQKQTDDSKSLSPSKPKSKSVCKCYTNYI